jgi:hypothetical protein
MLSISFADAPAASPLAPVNPGPATTTPRITAADLFLRSKSGSRTYTDQAQQYAQASKVALPTSSLTPGVGDTKEWYKNWKIMLPAGAVVVLGLGWLFLR